MPHNCFFLMARFLFFFSPFHGDFFGSTGV
jgi:hypothetical protein